MEYNNIKKSYNGKLILDIKKLSIEDGKTYVIMGSNGSGKTTLVKILCGIENIDGNICIKNKDVKIGYAPQKPFVFDMSLMDNLKVVCDIKDRNKVSRKAETLISEFGIEYLKNKNAKRFSGGEKQKLGLARLFMNDYDLVILDEPTSAMDDDSINIAENIIKEYTKNKTLLLITHDIEQAKRFSHEIHILKNGDIK